MTHSDALSFCPLRISLQKIRQCSKISVQTLKLSSPIALETQNNANLQSLHSHTFRVQTFFLLTALHISSTLHFYPVSTLELLTPGAARSASTFTASPTFLPLPAPASPPHSFWSGCQPFRKRYPLSNLSCQATS